VVTPSRAGFPRTARILRPGEFARVYEGRCSAAAGLLILYATPREDLATESRVGLSVSRRIGKAVLRNRWKRRLREAFRSVRSRLPPGTDYVIVVRSGDPGVGAAAARQIEATVESLAARVTGRRGYPTPPPLRPGADRPRRGRGR
jgi:ribonuclease P protein component